MNGRLENELKIDLETKSIISDMPYYVKEWNNYLIANNTTSSTRKDYVRKIRNFLLFINNDISDIELREINEVHVTDYLANKQTRNINGDIIKTSDSYRQSLWCCLNNFFDFLQDRGYIEKNYISKIKKPKNRDIERINKNRKLLTNDDFNKILLCANNDSNFKERDVAILSLFMTTGMRETALTNIDIDDIDFENNKLHITDKGDKMHEYYLSEKIINILKNWIVIRNNIIYNNKLNTRALFISQKNNRMTPKSIYYMVEKYSEKALGYSISPHKLRSGFVSIMYNVSHDIDFCRRAVGHSSISTTQRYIVTNNSEREQSMKTISNMINI